METLPFEKVEPALEWLPNRPTWANLEMGANSEGSLWEAFFASLSLLSE